MGYAGDFVRFANRSSRFRYLVTANNDIAIDNSNNIPNRRVTFGLISRFVPVMALWDSEFDPRLSFISGLLHSIL
jgi:hypothetical protein